MSEKRLINVVIGGIETAYTRKYTAYGTVHGVMDSIQKEYGNMLHGHGIKQGDKLRVGVSENKTGNSLHLPVTVGELIYI